MAVPVNVTEWMSAPVRLEDGCEFAIGDVHGMADRLEALLTVMGLAAQGEGHLTLLGDFIDRGPDSLEALRLAARPAPDWGFSGKTVLLANHEIVMLRAMRSDGEQAGMLSLWIDNGGDAVLEQLGIDPGESSQEADSIPDLLRAAVGDEAVAMLEGAATHREAGNLLFVHGGVDPAVPLADWFSRPRLEIGEDDHFAWIRFPFLRHEAPFEGGRIVVHGHTPEPSVLTWKGRRGEIPHRLDGWRLGLDGGSYRNGAVAGAEFRNGAYRVFVAG